MSSALVMDIDTPDEFPTTHIPSIVLLQEENEDIEPALIHSVSIISQPPPPYASIAFEGPPSYKEIFPTLFRTFSLPGGRASHAQQDYELWRCCRGRSNSVDCLFLKLGVVLLFCLFLGLFIYMSVTYTW